MPPLPDLTGLPPWAVTILMVCLALIYGLTHIGILQGKKAPVGAPIHLAGAVIDAKKADELIDAFEKHALAMDKLALAVDANTQATTTSTGQIVEARGDIKDLTHELIRSGSKHP